MTLNRSLFLTIVGSLFATLLIPLMVSNSLFFPYITGKNFAFRILVEIAGLAWVVLMLRDSQYRPRFSWLSICIVAFVAIVGVADIFSSNPVKSLLSNFERMEGWITLAHLLVYFYLLTVTFRTWDFWKRFFQFSLGVSTVVCIQGFMQAADPASAARIYGSFGNPTYLAVYMLFHIFIALILLARRLKERKVEPEGLWDTKHWYTDFAFYIYFLLIVLQFTVLFLTATRGSLLGLLGGLFLTAVFIAFTEREHRILRRVSIGVLAFMIIFSGLFLLFKNSSFIQNNLTLNRLASISATDNTTKSRFMIWNMAWEGTISSPKHFLIGWGQESFNYLFAKYYDPGMYGQEQWFDRSHNIIFDWLTAAGMLGLLSYLAIYLFTLYAIWRKSTFSNLEKGLLTSLLAGYFFHNLFVFDNITSYILFISILAYINAFSLKEVENKKAVEINEPYQYAGISLAVIVFIFVFYQFDYKPMRSNLALLKALTQTQIIAPNGTPSVVITQDNVNYFKEAVSYHTIGRYEVREQLMDAATRAVGSNTDSQVKKEIVELAKSELTNQLNETPNDVRYYVLGGSFYQGIGDANSANVLLKKAETLSPVKQSLLFALGSSYFALKQYTDALNTFKKAYELDTSFDEAKKLYGLVALYVGKEDITNSLLGPGPIMDPRFLGAYKETKHYALMLQYLQNSVAANPIDLNAKVSLAAGYLFAGDRNKSVTTLREALKLTNDASVQEQIQNLINDVLAGKNPFEPTIKK